MNGLPTLKIMLSSGNFCESSRKKMSKINMGAAAICLLLVFGSSYSSAYAEEKVKEETSSQPASDTAVTSQEETNQPPVQAQTQVTKAEEAKPVVLPDEAAVAMASQNTTSASNVSLDFKDADILNVLRVLSLKSGTNIVAGPEVQGTVTIRLQDVPWEKAMDVVLRTYGYVYEREGNIIRVTTKDKLATEELVTQSFVLNYTTSQEVEEAVKDILSERGKVKSVPRANTILITDVPTNMYKITQVIEKLDKPTQQVYIDAKIIRTELSLNENIGVNWNISGTMSGSSRPVTYPFTASGRDAQGNPINNQILTHFFPGQLGNRNEDQSSFPTDPATPTFSGNTFTYGTLSFSSLTTALNYLRTKTNTKIVSNPRIVVLNNQTAKVQVGSEIPIPSFERNETTGSFVISGFTYRDTGVVLNVTPHINQASEILVDLKPEVSAQGDNVSFAPSGQAGFAAPSFTTTSAETQLLIRDGETIAIGGLMRDAESTAASSVPGLSKIPLFGRLFRNFSRSSSGDANQKIETLFFITITIVDTQGQPVANRPAKASGVIANSPQPPVSAAALQQKPV